MYEIILPIVITFGLVMISFQIASIWSGVDYLEEWSKKLF